MEDRELFPPIKPEHAAAIGYVAAHWSLVEESLALTIYNLLGMHTIPGWALTAEMPTLQRIYTITAFVGLTANEGWINEWDDIAKVLDDLRNRRNEAIHSTWQVVGPEHWHTRWKARGRVTVKQGTIHTKSLHQLSDDILALWKRHIAFMVKLLQGNAGKIINQMQPPGWETPNQALLRKAQARTRNPKRERQMRRRQLRRDQERDPE